MSAPTTYDDTRGALMAAGRRVVSTAVLRDVDTVTDADAVALTAAPDGQFAAAWRADGTTRHERVSERTTNPDAQRHRMTSDSKT